MQKDIMVASDLGEMQALQVKKMTLEQEYDATPEGRKRLAAMVEQAEQDSDSATVQYLTNRIVYGQARWEMQRQALAVAQGNQASGSVGVPVVQEAVSEPVRESKPSRVQKPKQVVQKPAEEPEEVPDAPVTAEQMAKGRSLKQYLAEHGGKALFPALYDTDGNLVPASFQYVESNLKGKKGQKVGVWRIWSKEGGKDNWFTPSVAKNAELREKNNAKKGFFVGAVLAEAQVVRNRKTGDVYLSRTTKGFSDVEQFITKPSEQKKSVPKVPANS